MAPILVTGGAGFIGSNFVRRAVGAGEKVVTLDALTYAGDRDNLDGLPADRHDFVHGSIADRALVAELLERHRPRAIVNFAAETHVDRSIDDAGAFIYTNMAGTFEMLEAALGYWRSLAGAEAEGFRFLHVSTDEVYGSIETGAATEQSPYRPRSPYAASKAAADHLVRAWHVTYGLPAVITNCTNNYGPYQFPEKLIPLTILTALEGGRLPVYGDGGHRRDWLHVDDHCAALLLVLSKGRLGETYNIGGGDDLTTLDVVGEICRVLDERRPRPGFRHASLISFVEDRPGHDRRYALDHGKIAKDLGWRPQIAFADGLAATVTWYLDHAEWCQSVRRRGYGGERLGLARRAAT